MYKLKYEYLHMYKIQVKAYQYEDHVCEQQIKIISRKHNGRCGRLACSRDS